MQSWSGGLGETGLRYILGRKLTEFADVLDVGGRGRKEIGMIPRLLTLISEWMVISFTVICQWGGDFLAEN